MSARRGSLTFLRFFVQGKPPKDLRQRYLRAIRLRAFQPLKPEDEASEASGWCVMERPFDLAFEMGNVFSDHYVLLGLRVDRWRVPSSIVQSQLAEEEQRLLGKTGREKLARNERKELKQRIVQKLRRKLLPATRAFDVCWNLDAGTVLLCAHSRRLAADFLALFEKTFSLQLLEDSPYTAAHRTGLSASDAQILDRLPPVSYSNGRKVLAGTAAAPESLTAKPAAKAQKSLEDASEHLLQSIEGTRFLGPEFLLWLWLRAQLVGEPFSFAELGDYEVWIDRQITLQSALDPNERVTVRGAAPADSSEAREAVKAQKFPVRGRVVLRSEEREFTCVFDGPRFAVGAAVVPTVQNDQPDEAFIERMALVEQLLTLFDELYRSFLGDRLNTRWSEGWEPALVSWFEDEAIPPKVLQRLQPARARQGASERNARRPRAPR